MQFNKLNNYYNLGDDFAQYIMQSKAIFDSPIEEYELQKELNSYSIIQIGPNSYPFGYPLVLKFIEFFLNGDFKYYKLANIIFFNFFIIFTYLILRLWLFLCRTLLVKGLSLNSIVRPQEEQPVSIILSSYLLS